MEHSTLGKMEYEGFWKRKYEIAFFSKKYRGMLIIRGELEEDIEKIQIEAFEKFSLNKKIIIFEVEEKLFEYYCSVLEEYRDKFGEDANIYAPILKEKEELKKLLEFEAIYIPYSFEENERVIGVLFKSKWEPGHGIGVKIVNEKVVEVGFQDIVL